MGRDQAVAISGGRVMARLGQLLRDLRRVVGGSAAFLKYLVGPGVNAPLPGRG
jgi:hypothetical protein